MQTTEQTPKIEAVKSEALKLDLDGFPLPESLLTVRQAAQQIGVPEDRVRYWIRSRRIPYLRLRGTITIRLNPQALREWSGVNFSPITTH